MKVEGPNPTSGVKPAAKAGAKKDGADGAFGTMVDEAGAAADSAPVTRTAPAGVLDSLLALQSAEGAQEEEARKKARKRGAELLDQLERIRMGLLSGELPLSAVEQLAQALAAHREKVTDPQLAEILDEIDLRAQVELAKMGK